MALGAPETGAADAIPDDASTRQVAGPERQESGSPPLPGTEQFPVVALLPEGLNHAWSASDPARRSTFPIKTMALPTGSIASIIAAVDAAPLELEHRVVVFVVGADDFLAGASLDETLEQLDGLLRLLTDLPAMAVIGSMPDLSSCPLITQTRVPANSIRTTIDIWNRSIAEAASSYSAEYVDVRSVPLAWGSTNERPSQDLVIPAVEVRSLFDALAPAIARAMERIQSDEPLCC